MKNESFNAKSKKASLKIASFFMAILMVLCLFPVSVFAEEAVTIIASGYCGGDTTATYNADSKAYENLWWTLDKDGILTVGGEGEMKNYSDVRPQWQSYSNNLKGLVIEDGVTSIGEVAFSGYSGLTGDLVIPDSVTDIGDYAFFHVTDLPVSL